MELFDSTGKPLKDKIPSPLTGAFCRRAHYKGPASVDIIHPDGEVSFETKYELVRAQFPHIVTLLVYSSKFQLQATKREYFVYAPMDLTSSAKLAVRLWRRWERPARPKDSVIEDLNDDYPKIDDATVSEPIDDNFFADMWRTVRGKPHRFAGDPNDPFAFTCLDQDVMVYKTSDFQQGLRVTV